MKKSLESCRNCKFNSCFREDECNECNLNTFLNFRGYEYKFILNDKLSSEFKELERLAEIGKATEKALDINGANAYICDGYGIDGSSIVELSSIEDLLEWYKESEAE